MRSSRPYLLRGFFEWIIDNHCTPYIVVNTLLANVRVPTDYIEEGRIVLNIAPMAVKDLIMANDHLEFNARFAGVPHDIWVPVKAITAIYAKENGRGMVFKEEEDIDEEEVPPSPPPPAPKKGSGVSKLGGGKSHLTLVTGKKE